MIKTFFRPLIVFILRLEAKLVLRRYQPKIVAVTGNVGKTSAKEAIALGLKLKATVRESPKSWNSEIGVPLTILGLPNAWGNPVGWLKNIIHGFSLIISHQPYPEWLVLEVGADRVGDIKSLARWLRPHIAVLTSLPVVPVHVEFFPSPESLFAEKGSLLESVRQGGTVIINEDDERVRDVLEKLLAKGKLKNRKIVRIGWSESADIKINNDHLTLDPTGAPNGIACKVDHLGHTIPLRLTNLYGSHQLYAILFGLAVGITVDYPLLSLAEKLETYTPPPGRGRLLVGVKGTWIIDDSYNASPAAVAAAVKTLKKFPGIGRRIAVLGDMLELGTYTIDAHREVGKMVAGICDLVFTVGVRAKFITEGAVEAGYSQKKLRHFDDSHEVGTALEDLLVTGDIILVKGSQSVRLERVVEEIMAEPDKKDQLLCRQEPEWLKR